MNSGLELCRVDENSLFLLFLELIFTQQLLKVDLPAVTQLACIESAVEHLLPASDLVLEQPVLVDLVSDSLRLQLEIKHLQAASDDLFAYGLPTDHLLYSTHGKKSKYVSPHHQHLPVKGLELLAFHYSATNDGTSEALG